MLKQTMQVNKKLLPIKGHFFLFNAGTAPLVPYLSTYARQLGFSSATVGLIYSVLPVFGLIAKPLFGIIADRFKLQKILFIIFQIITIMSFSAIYLIPDNGNHISVHLDNMTTIRSCYGAAGTLNTCEVIALEHENTSLCDMNCDMTPPHMWETVCEHWNISQYCTTLEMNNIQYGAHLKFGLDEGFPNNLSYVGTVQLSSTSAINKCVYMQLRQIQLLDGSIHNPTCISQAQNQTETNMYHTSCNITCDNTLANELFLKASLSIAESTTQYTQQFWLFFICMIVSWIGQAVVVSIADAICFNLLDDKPSLYGKQRLWGSFGWGIFSLLTGTLIDLFSEGYFKDYTIAFILMFIFMVLDVVVSCFIKTEYSRMSLNILKDIGTLLKLLPITLFFLWTVAVGLCTGLLWQFLFWHIEDISALSCDSSDYVKTLQGLVSAVQTFGGEIPFLFLSGNILKKLGHVNTMSLVLFAFGVRFVLYSYLTNPWWMLPIEILQGLTLGMFYPTMTSFANVVSPPGTETTVQGLVGAVFEGIGTSLGSIIGGVLYRIYGGWLTFRIFGNGSLIIGMIHAIIHYVINRRPNAT